MRHEMQIDRAALAAELAEERREQELRSDAMLHDSDCDCLLCEERQSWLSDDDDE